MHPDRDYMKTETERWVLYIFIAGIVSFLATFIYKSSFGIIAENITINIRRKLYGSILQKHIGWFDVKDNSSGVLTTVLASDV